MHRYWYTPIYFPHWPVIRIQKAIPIICLGLKATKAIIFGKRPYLWGDHIFSVTTFKNHPHCLATKWLIKWQKVVEPRDTKLCQSWDKDFCKNDQPNQSVTNDILELIKMFLARKTTNWWPLPSWADLFHHLMASARTGHCPGGGCIWESGKPHRVA